MGGDGGTGGMGGDGGGTGGVGGIGGSDLCQGVTCEDDECRSDGVCDAGDGVCDYTLVADGTACADGECLDGVCAAEGAFSCSEQGIRDAIAEGGGPHFFACDGPTTVASFFVVSGDVILDGEGSLTLDLSPFFVVLEGATAELVGFVLTGGSTVVLDSAIVNTGTLTIADTIVSGCRGVGIESTGVLNLIDSIVSGCRNVGIESTGVLNLIDTVVSDNRFGIFTEGTAMLRNSTISSNTSSGIVSWGGSPLLPPTLTIVNSTISGNGEDGIWACGPLTMVNSTVSGNTGSAIYKSRRDCGGFPDDIIDSLIDGDCVGVEPTESSRHNIESPGNTCGFDQPTDQANVSAEDLNLGPLADNGGPTMTHALGEGSVAIDHIPAEDCVDADGEPLTTDQRGQPRPETGGTMCDVGAFEVQEGSL
jgi:hypothetical protein